MNEIVKKIILFVMIACCCATLLLTWVDYSGVQTLNGTSILTGNLLLTLIIFGLYGVSVLFYEKSPKVFFSTGLSSLSMLFAIMFSAFEGWGRFTNTCIGPYAGLLSVTLTIIVFVLLNIKGKKPDNI